MDGWGDVRRLDVAVRLEFVLGRDRNEPPADLYERYECEIEVGNGPVPDSAPLRWMTILAWLACEPQGCKTRDALYGS